MGSRRSSGRWRRPGTLLPLLLVLSLAPLAVGWHWAKLGWKDEHINYPTRPTSYSEIVATFGQPCNDNTHAITMSWTAYDSGKVYWIRFHRKLGGRGTAMVSDKGGRSTNLDNDVYGHIMNEHLNKYVWGGIWGYACRYIKGTTTWSTHAWGIAIDIAASYEHCCDSYDSVINYYIAPTFRDHRWYWGKNFGDPMHFQYAKGY